MAVHFGKIASILIADFVELVFGLAMRWCLIFCDGQFAWSLWLRQFTTAVLSIGLLVSTVTNTQQHDVQLIYIGIIHPYEWSFHTHSCMPGGSNGNPS